MKNKLTIYFLLIFSGLLSAQNEIILKGNIKTDTVNIADVNVYNLRSLKGVITNRRGEFTIKVKLNDRLKISAIAYKAQIISVDSVLFLKKKILVHLLEKVTNLEEVIVKRHHLSGNLNFDAVNVPINFKKNTKIKITAEDMDMLEFEQAKDIRERNLSVATNDGLIATPVNFIAIAKIVTKGLRNKIKAKKQKNFFLVAFPNLLRNELTDSYIINELHIPKDKIDSFLISCATKDLISLYKNNKRIELYDFLLKKSIAFLSNQKKE